MIHRHRRALSDDERARYESLGTDRSPTNIALRRKDEPAIRLANH